MRLTLLCLVPEIVIGACTTEPRPSLHERTLRFSCGDVVAIGRVKNSAFQPGSSADEVLGHGWMSATLSVRRVVRGADLPPALPIRYFAHTYMRENRDFMFVLKPVGGGAYEVETGQLVSMKPLLPHRCG